MENAARLQVSIKRSSVFSLDCQKSPKRSWNIVIYFEAVLPIATFNVLWAVDSGECHHNRGKATRTWLTTKTPKRHLIYLITLIIRGNLQVCAVGLHQTFGAVEQVFQSGSHVLPHGLVLILQLAPFLLFLLDNTVEQPEALPQSRVQQLHLLLRAGLLRFWGRGHEALSIWGVAGQEGLPLRLKW